MSSERTVTAVLKVACDGARHGGNSKPLGALAQLDLQAGNRVLELGAGDGGLLGYLLSRAPELQYIGLDISGTMVAQARAFNAPFIQAGLADHVLYDGTRLPLADASFDRVLAVNTV